MPHRKLCQLSFVPHALALALACVGSLFSADAWALGSATEDQQHAHTLVGQATERFQQGRFQEAADLLTEAHRLDPKPILLYNRARAYESLGDAPGLRRATEDYAQYLVDDPAAKDRLAVEKRIDVLRGQIARLEQPPPPAPPPEPTVEVPERHPSALPWVIAGVGAAGLVAGGTLGGLALAKHDSAESPSSSMVSTASDNSAARSLATAANVSFLAGGIVTLAGVAWGIVDVRAATSHRSGPTVGSVYPWLGPRSAGVLVVIP
jgi:tetratricopeptide (TPR) repeat protein